MVQRKTQPRQRSFLEAYPAGEESYFVCVRYWKRGASPEPLRRLRRCISQRTQGQSLQRPPHSGQRRGDDKRSSTTTGGR
jgi:hypothetical protein